MASRHDAHLPSPASVRATLAIVTAMATQSLYRRYRPRRFSEVKGQDHVVRALRTSVAEGREGQAYLFSGPRGTGKTTSARILAKVLNCTNPDGGEPCCECESCMAVERGTSYDVHELDAASNNGVDAMRDLIEKASLGTPGRHKVYILDEVHMLSKAAEAALLKTLEEPPPHVVFVLATTDPQKMSDTIRSRTQHLQFHLLPADTLQAHVRWVADDAGLDVSDEAIEQVLQHGAGSARDALSALELVATTGGEGAETVPLHEFVEAMIEQDPGRALSMAAGAIALGRDPRTLTEELIGFLRNGFLSIMAPDLVQLPSQRIEEMSERSRRLGAAGLVRGIEYLGAALTEMRQAPDPRVLLEVAIVRLTTERPEVDVAALISRIAKLEKQVADGVPAAAAAPVDPGTGRAALGGRARSAAPTRAPDAARSADASPRGEPAEPVAPSPQPDAAPSAPAVAESGAGNAELTRDTWEDTVRPALRGMARAVFAPAEFVGATSTSLTLSLPNPVHREKCEQHRADVERALSDAAGGPVTLELVLGGGDGPAPARSGDDGGDDAAVPKQGGGGVADRSGEPGSDAAGAPAGESPRRAAERALAELAANPPEPVAAVPDLPDDDDVDVSELIDAPPEHVKTPIDRLAEAFPGSEMVEEKY